MGLEFFRRSIELQQKYAKPGQQILNTLQTNGTLLNDEWGAFLAEHEFLVGISIDGPREIHDTYRVSKGGKPTFDRVIRGLDVLKAHGVDWNVLTTLHAANGDHGRRVYRFLREAAALQTAPRRRPPRVLGTPRQAPPPRHMALGCRAPRRLREAQNAPTRRRLTPQPATTTTSPHPRRAAPAKHARRYAQPAPKRAARPIPATIHHPRTRLTIRLTPTHARSTQITRVMNDPG